MSRLFSLNISSKTKQYFISSIYLTFEWLGQKVLKMLATKDTILQSYLFISLRSLSAKRCWVLYVCVFLFFASVWSWENSVPCYSYITVPTCEKMSCRWCLSLIFHVLHMSIHTQKAHSSSYRTRKTGKCFQMENFFRSFHQMKQTSLASADFSGLLCRANKFSIKASFGLSRFTVEDCALGLLLLEHMPLSGWVLDMVDLMGTIRDPQIRQVDPMLKITPKDRTEHEIFH